ncbi:MAG: hypothetical protein M2R46_00194 [Verrucomicrobia subdivision 3 bacterium]|nr:hypothetical protein [Limisphaerales bacterium]
MKTVYALLPASLNASQQTTRALPARNKPLLLVAALMTASALLPMKTHAVDFSGNVLELLASQLTGGWYDAAKGLITQPGESVARAGHVEMDFAQAAFVQYYADELLWLTLAHTRQKNHLQGEEHLLGNGIPLEDRRFSFYDYEIADYDPEEGLGGDWERVAGLGLRLPHDTDENWIEGVTRLWDAKYVVHSTYGCTDEGLRRPAGKFEIRIEYKLADLTYDTSRPLGNGMVSTERDKIQRRRVQMSKVQQDKVTNVDLLEDDTEIVEGPVAYGVCKRIWKLQYPPIGLVALRTLMSSEGILAWLDENTEWVVHELPVDYGD